MEHDMKALRYDPKGWQETYITARNDLYFHLSAFSVDISHFGATSVASCRSDRNVDVLVIADSIVDVSSITLKLQTSGYKFIPFMSNAELSMFVSKKRIGKYAVSLRVVLRGSHTHERLNAFMMYLKDNYNNVIKYNDFRAVLSEQCGSDWKTYYRRKRDYIDSILDMNFTFDENK